PDLGLQARKPLLHLARLLHQVADARQVEPLRHLRLLAPARLTRSRSSAEPRHDRFDPALEQLDAELHEGILACLAIERRAVDARRLRRRRLARNDRDEAQRALELARDRGFDRLARVALEERVRRFASGDGDAQRVVVEVDDPAVREPEEPRRALALETV